MKKYAIKAAVVLLVLLLALLCTSCVRMLLMNSNWNPQGDWLLQTCGDYYILRTNSRNIIVGRAHNEQADSFDIILESYITCFQYNSRYLAVRRLVVENRELLDDIQSLDTDAADYYLIDTETGEVYGSFVEKAEFEQACAEQSVGNLGEWIPTVPVPDGAQF